MRSSGRFSKCRFRTWPVGHSCWNTSWRNRCTNTVIVVVVVILVVVGIWRRPRRGRRRLLLPLPRPIPILPATPQNVIVVVCRTIPHRHIIITKPKKKKVRILRPIRITTVRPARNGTAGTKHGHSMITDLVYEQISTRN